MADIVGEPFDEYVLKQITDRQIIHGQGINSVRDNLTLSYLNSRTPWIKLSSGVSIQGTDGDKKLKDIGLGGHPSFMGPDGEGQNRNTGLSNFFVLFNGTSDNSGTLFSGINTSTGDIGQSILNKTAYGIGGNEFGIRPMPGITSCETKFRNRGSIREGTIQIKAWNRSQLEIISLLYMRLGFPMLLEWGHSIIIDEFGKINTKPDFSLSKEFLGLKYKTDNEVLAALEENRKKSAGNYDGMYGTVYNFDWTFNKDGSYDITLKLISIGAVVESLKANVYIKDNTKEASSTKENTSPTETPETDADWITTYKYSHYIGNVFFKFQQSQMNKNPNNGVRFTSISDLVPIQGGTDKDFVFITDLNRYYIRFGAFWSLLQQMVPIKKTSLTDEGSPLIYFEPSGLENNPIYTEQFQLSSDPRKCLIGGFSITNKVELPNKTYPIFSSFPNFKNTDNNGILLGKSENIYVNTTLILQKLNDNKDDNGDVKLYDFVQSIIGDINMALGSVNKLTLIVDENTNRAKVIDETPIANYPITNEAQNKLPTTFNFFKYLKKNNESTTAGFIKDFSLKTEITNNLASMITIGATANKNVVGEDATAFSKWNKGLVSIIGGQQISYPGDKKSSDSPTLQLIKENKQLFAQYSKWLSYQNLTPPKSSTSKETVKRDRNDAPPPDPPKTIKNLENEEFDNYAEVVKNFLTFFKDYTLASKKDITTSTSSRGFLPVNLSLTMDGLSGIKIYQQIKVDTDQLPHEYPSTMKFLIKGVTNKVDNNGWVTSIETVSVPIIDNMNETKNNNNKTAPMENKEASRNTPKTAYPEIPFTSPPPPSDLLPYDKAVKYLKSKYGDDLGKAVFSVLWAEASKSGTAFRSAGGHNYAGVQTDNARWGAPGITGQYSRIDSGGVQRSFAMFNSDEIFLDFMASRIKVKGFSGSNGDVWTTTYINKWWSPKAKAEYTKGTPKYNSKLAIYTSAINKYNSIA